MSQWIPQIDPPVKRGEKKPVPKNAPAPQPDADTPEHPALALRRSYGAYAVKLGDMVFARAEAALAPFGLTPLAYDAMVCILEGHGMSQQDLSRRVGIYAPKMVAVLDGLQKRGLVERQVSAADRRRHELKLTPAAHALLDQATAVVAAVEDELFAGVSAEDRARFAALVSRLEADERNQVR